MSNVGKQVADMKPSTGITTAESNEYQRRWEDQRWDRASKEGNYDRSRDHLNFEIAKGCIVRPIDKTRTVGEKIAARFTECGIENPNIKRKTPNIRICAKFVFGGSRERMHELAFGEQKIDLAKGADNSHIARCKDIEEWAKDIYRFASEKWGEDNIAGFYVHLDETNPHIHCCVLPITQQNRLSFKQVFSGATKWEYRDKMLALHDGLAVCNKKWSLERGSNIHETGAKHRPTEEYRRDLANECSTLESEIAVLRSQLFEINKELRKASIKQKSLATMVKNLEEEKARLTNKKAELETLIQKGNMDTKLLLSQLEKLNHELSTVDGKLLDKKGKLSVAKTELDDLQQTVSHLKERESALRAEVGKAVEDIQEQINFRLSTAILPEIFREFRTQFERKPSVIPVF